MGIRLVIYIDDVLIMAESGDISRVHAQMVLDLLLRLSFSLSWAKRQLTPSKLRDFLGIRVDSKRMQFILSEAKVRVIEKQCQKLLNEPSTTVRVLASLIDKISASSSVATVLTAPLYYRRWLCLKNRLFRSRPGCQTFVRAITLDREA